MKFKQLSTTWARVALALVVLWLRHGGCVEQAQAATNFYNQGEVSAYCANLVRPGSNYSPGFKVLGNFQLVSSVNARSQLDAAQQDALEEIIPGSSTQDDYYFDAPHTLASNKKVKKLPPQAFYKEEPQSSAMGALNNTVEHERASSIQYVAPNTENLTNSGSLQEPPRAANQAPESFSPHEGRRRGDSFYPSPLIYSGPTREYSNHYSSQQSNGPVEGVSSTAQGSTSVVIKSQSVPMQPAQEVQPSKGVTSESVTPSNAGAQQSSAIENTKQLNSEGRESINSSSVSRGKTPSRDSAVSNDDSQQVNSNGNNNVVTVTTTKKTVTTEILPVAGSTATPAESKPLATNKNLDVLNENVSLKDILKNPTSSEIDSNTTKQLLEKRVQVLHQDLGNLDTKLNTLKSENEQTQKNLQRMSDQPALRQEQQKSVTDLIAEVKQTRDSQLSLGVAPDAYMEAQNMLIAGNLSESAEAFKNFLTSSASAAEGSRIYVTYAYYWLGRVAAIYKQYTQAATYFVNAYQAHNVQEVTLKALYWLAEAYTNLARSSDACSVIKRFNEEYQNAQQGSGIKLAEDTWQTLQLFSALNACKASNSSAPPVPSN